jgi:broad specificity phosphatase PhoE
VAGVVLSDPAEGIPRWGLTATGRSQVEAALTAAAGLLGPSRSEIVVVSSDFRRARETAELSAGLLGADPPRLEAALRERFFGAHEGLSNERYESVWRGDRDDPAHTQAGVESAQATAARTASLIERLEGEGSGRTYLLVSHGDALQLLQTAFLGESPATHRSRPHWPPAEVRLLGGPDAR